MKSKTFSLGLIAVALLALANTVMAAPAAPPSVPDAGASVLLLGVSIGAVALARKFVR